MPIKDSLKHQRRAEEAIRQIAYSWGLPGWMYISVAFDPRSNEGKDARVACETVCDWEYRQVSFIWNMHILATMTDEDVRDTARHELAHALIAPLWSCIDEKVQEEDEIINKLHELATENIAKAFKHLEEEGNERTFSVTPS